MSNTMEHILTEEPNDEDYLLAQAEEEYLRYEKLREEADDRDRSFHDKIQEGYDSMEEKLELLDNE